MAAFILLKYGLLCATVIRKSLQTDSNCNLEKVDALIDWINQAQTEAKEMLHYTSSFSELLPDLCTTISDDTAFTDNLLQCTIANIVEEKTTRYFEVKRNATAVCEQACPQFQDVTGCQKLIDYNAYAEHYDYLTFCLSFHIAETCIKTTLKNCVIADAVYENEISETVRKFGKGICDKECTELNNAVSVLQECYTHLPREISQCRKYEMMLTCVNNSRPDQCSDIEAMIDYYIPQTIEFDETCGITRHLSTTTKKRVDIPTPSPTLVVKQTTQHSSGGSTHAHTKVDVGRGSTLPSGGSFASEVSSLTDVIRNAAKTTDSDLAHTTKSPVKAGRTKNHGNSSQGCAKGFLNIPETFILYLVFILAVVRV